MNRFNRTDEERDARKRATILKAQAKWRAKNRENERARSKAYHAAHRVEQRAYGQAYRAARKTVLNAASRAYGVAHRKELRAKAKAKRQANAIEMRALDRAYRLAHKEQFRASKNTYNASTKGKARSREYERARYVNNQKEEAARHLAWARANRGLMNACTMRYYASKRHATPVWANHTLIEAIYIEAARLTSETGIRHEVDHVIPMQSQLVCGLHCEGNLQILTKRANRAKWNQFTPHIGLPPLPSHEAPS